MNWLKEKWQKTKTWTADKWRRFKWFFIIPTAAAATLLPVVVPGPVEFDARKLTIVGEGCAKYENGQTIPVTPEEYASYGEAGATPVNADCGHDFDAADRRGIKLGDYYDDGEFTVYWIAERAVELPKGETPKGFELNEASGKFRLNSDLKDIFELNRAEAAIAHSTSTVAGCLACSSITFPFNGTDAAGNTMLVVGSAHWDATDADEPIVSITFNSDAVTKAIEELAAVGTDALYYRIAPDATAGNVVVTYTGTVTQTDVEAWLFTGVAQSAPESSDGGNSASATSVSATVTSTSGAALVDAAQLGTGTLSADTGQTVRYNEGDAAFGDEIGVTAGAQTSTWGSGGGATAMGVVTISLATPTASCTPAAQGDWYVQAGDVCYVSADTYVQGDCIIYGTVNIIESATLNCRNIKGQAGGKINGTAGAKARQDDTGKQVTFDSTANGGDASGASSDSFTLTVANHARLNGAIAVVCVVARDTTAGDRTADTVTVGGTTATSLTSADNGTDLRAQLYYVVNPVAGANTVSVDMGAAATGFAISGAVFYNVDQTSPFSDNDTTTANAESMTRTLTTAVAGEMGVDCGWTKEGPASGVTVGANQTTAAKLDVAAGGVNDTLVMSYEPSVSAAASVTMSWSWTGSEAHAFVAGTLQTEAQ